MRTTEILAVFTPLSLGFLTTPVYGQQIFDIWQTTWDRSKLLTSLAPAPINFTTPGAIGAADIVISDTSVFQSVVGFGGSFTDSSALVLNNLKTKNSANYWALLNTMFNPTEGAKAAGLSYLRVPLGASDFSATKYTFDDTAGDTSLSQFSVDRSPSYLFSVIQDIKSINSALKVHVLPWSPPAWMKDSNSINGGNFLTSQVNTYANYLLKSVQGFNNKGIPLYAISLQNEPQNNNPTYPSCIVTVAQAAQLGTALRTLLNNNGFSAVKIIGFEHNWDNAATYPVQLMQQAPNAFAGVAFHCYSGGVANQDSFHSAFPNKEIYFTECAGTIGSDWWSDIKWYMDNLWIGAIEHNAMAGLMWNVALDGTGKPILPGSNSCGGGCRALVSVNSDGTYSFNQEFYSMAQASKAIIPRDPGGPFGKRIGVTVGGSLSWALRVGAYVTGRVSSTDWYRYSLVVLNWDDSASTSWNPQPVAATIEFKGAQAKYTFPVGVTTLWFYAAPNGSLRSVEVEGQKDADIEFRAAGQN